MADIDPARAAAPPAPPVSAPRISRERMVLLFMVMLTTAAGNTAMQSVMPSIGTELGIADVWISLAYSWSALLWVVCAPLWAARSDQRGRKAMMALGLVGFIVSFSLCGFALWLGLSGVLPAFWALIAFAAARSLYGGFGSAAPPAVQAYVASRTPRAERTQALSLVASSFGLGTVIGPALAPLMVLPGLGLTGPFVLFALIGVIAMVALRLRLPDDEPQFAARGNTYDAPYAGGAAGGGNQSKQSADPAVIEDDDDEDEEQVEPHKLRWFEPRLRPWVTVGLLGGHAQAMVLGIAGFLVLDRLGLRSSPGEGTGPVGLVLMSGAIATLLAQWGLIPRFDLGPRSATLSGIAMAAVGVAMLGVAQDLHMIALSFAIASLGFGLFRPGSTSGTSLAVTRAEQGQASGITASVAGASYIYAPALGVYLYNHSEWLGFGLIVALCFAVFVYGWWALDRDKDLIRSRS
ncbi:MFS transporter [Qipengyuania marisflavi]|uniref:MFS transporter n=1 Tax=Qipengyuania marisflavi TaxID=2486356 RepID=A0A5S3P2Z3_9SPHN|nr:MFS transporter [Qipengyuania marisflavi]TMM47352.1 MFS transporter [Qipengyuania marisflavi]